MGNQKGSRSTLKRLHGMFWRKSSSKGLLPCVLHLPYGYMLRTCRVNILHHNRYIPCAPPGMWCSLFASSDACFVYPRALVLLAQMHQRPPEMIMQIDTKAAVRVDLQVYMYQVSAIRQPRACRKQAQLDGPALTPRPDARFSSTLTLSLGSHLKN